MFEKSEDIRKSIFNLAFYADPTGFLRLKQVSKTWERYVTDTENSFQWDDFLVIYPFKKSAKQTFFQDLDVQRPRFLSTDILFNRKQNWELFINELAEECSSLKERSGLEDKTVLFSSIEKFLKQMSFKQEMLMLFMEPEVTLWKNISFLTVISNSEEQGSLLNFFIEYHSRIIPFLLLTKKETLLTCINSDLLDHIVSHAPQFIPLILENPHEYVKNLCDESTCNYYKEQYEQQVKQVKPNCEKKALMTSDQQTYKNYQRV